MSREPKCPCCGFYSNRLADTDDLDGPDDMCSIGNEAEFNKCICEDAMLINLPCSSCVVVECPKHGENKDGNA